MVRDELKLVWTMSLVVLEELPDRGKYDLAQCILGPSASLAMCSLATEKALWLPVTKIPLERDFQKKS